MTISNRAAGVVGLCLSTSLLILAIWRLVYHFSANGLWWTSRRLFHLLFCVAMAVEAFSYADLCGLITLAGRPELSESMGYILLEIIGRSFLEVIAYSVVTVLWLETVGKNTDALVQKVLILCGPIIVLASMLQSVDMCRSKFELRWIYQLHCSVEASCWLLHCIAAVACCLLTTKRIVSLSTFPQFSAGVRVKILVKALLPMIMCSLCYGIRSVCLYTYDLESRTRTYERESLVWWIGFSWVPTLIPSLMLLYSTRKRDVVLGDFPDSSVAPLLLSPPGPPAEAFVSFQRLDPESFWSPLRFRFCVDVSEDYSQEIDDQSNLVEDNVIRCGLMAEERQDQ